jgi:hypothetical protein
VLPDLFWRFKGHSQSTLLCAYRRAPSKGSFSQVSGAIGHGSTRLGYNIFHKIISLLCTFFKKFKIICLLSEEELNGYKIIILIGGVGIVIFDTLNNLYQTAVW